MRNYSLKYFYITHKIWLQECDAGVPAGLYGFESLNQIPVGYAF
jgi:hypothetical protein